MVLVFEPNSILYDQSIKEVEFRLFKYAQKPAVLDAIDAARAPIGLFPRASISGVYDDILSSLAFAWNETGKWPAGGSDDHKSSALLEKMRENETTSFWGESGIWPSPQESRTWDEKCIQAYLDPPMAPKSTR